MKKQTVMLRFFSLFPMLLLTTLTACTFTQASTQPVHTIDSGVVLFSNITTHKVAKGTIIRGNVRRKSQAGKRITIPGHIHIMLKTKDGKVLETIKARTHRKYANSRAWHFDGVLKASSTKDAEITVKYHGRHSR